ncbi:glutamine-hydrolyzing GMP synthase [Defluviitalea raffinosedens]|uniref:GMP synthase [glutamine-hydrolyzing] n=1 Tax=Defluviitalea raffinosedens TaxID=1450156 RepID=A0A7C8LCI4_9FIRM|nr:glutamine-hydrolyzing GMP synthase [Defluviitalea raffinosedens]KAE9631376.1 glutamine-hydrolyzing GMP synthase [Defluviitalea raffinosedens]
MNHELIIVLDFGGQYNQLIARRVREANVYCEVLSYDTSIDEIKKRNPKGIIFTGGPSVVYEENAPMVEKEIFELGIPVLGICYGSQLMGHVLGGKVAKADQREYGKTDLIVRTDNPLFKDVEEQTVCWMSHTYYISEPPEGFEVIATTGTCPVAAMADTKRKLYGVQFHPEVMHTPKGTQMLKNFLYDVCGCSGDWIMKDFAEESIKKLKEKISNKKVLCALSGGVDSSVAAVLIHKAVGKQLTCIFVDHGLLRKNEGDEVEKVFREQFDMNLIRVNAQDRFLDKLKGVTDPETKRKIIGEEFIRVFEAEAKKIGTVDFLVQGTIYPDVIESGTKNAAVIKSHHNVGGLPDYVDFKEIIEPLRDLFKDEVRSLGRALGIPEFLVSRQPFPGPGLAIRIIGEVTREKIAILQEADYIYREEIVNAGLDKEIGQYFAVLTNLRSVGVMGDERTYSYTIALRGVSTTDFMTADWARIPHDVLAKISNRIVNEVEHVNRIVYDITSKPPATIEWE